MKKLLLALSTLVLVACGSTPTPSVSNDGTLTAYYNQTVEWKSCDKGLECATVVVPLDYKDLKAGDIHIAIARHKATKNSQQVIFLNPGGPGGSGIDYLEYWKEQFSPSLTANADLVSWDPRGVKRSAPVDCISDEQMDADSELDPTPDTSAEVAQFWSTSTDEYTQCVEKTGKVLSHVSTVESAQDLDILRELLNQDTLNYLGKSYGTQLGATYAKLFPSKVGRFVLDGAVDVALSTKQMSLDQAAGFDTAIHRMARYCVENYDPCPIGSTPNDVVAKLEAFLKKIDSKPLETNNPDRSVFETHAWNAVLMPLYVADGGWDWLIQGLDSAYNGDGSDLLAISDWATSRNPNGSYDDNSNEAFIAISCLDSGVSTNKNIEAMIPEFQKAAPITGRMMAWGEGSCVDWPVTGTTAPSDVKVDVATPIVVIGNKYDPATPLKWAEALAKELDDSVFIEMTGDGHTAYFSGSTCIDNLVDKFFLNGDVPTANTVCQPDNPLLAD